MSKGHGMIVRRLIQDWYDLDREDQDNLNAITQEEDQIKEKEKKH